METGQGSENWHRHNEGALFMELRHLVKRIEKRGSEATAKEKARILDLQATLREIRGLPK